MKILVTGGAGFIGTNFINYWLTNHQDDIIVNLDVVSYAGNPDNLKKYVGSSRYKFVKGDIRNKKLIREISSDVNAVVHFAAESHVTRSEDQPEIFYENNVEGTKSLLGILVENKALKRVIHISTDEVYGSISSGYFKEKDKLPGDGQASSAYAKSKAISDDIAQSFFGQLPITIVRPTNNFGPFQYPEKALPRWATNALIGQPLKVWGTGQQIRDWLFTLDTAKALELIMEKGAVNDIYNIGANHQPEHNNLEIANKVLGSYGKSSDLIQMIPDPRPGHDFRYGVDTAKLKKLGWKPGNFDDQFEETLLWYKKNKNWWQPLKQEAESLYANKEKS